MKKIASLSAQFKKLIGSVFPGKDKSPSDQLWHKSSEELLKAVMIYLFDRLSESNVKRIDARLVYNFMDSTDIDTWIKTTTLHCNKLTVAFDLHVECYLSLSEKKRQSVLNVLIQHLKASLKSSNRPGNNNPLKPCEAE